MNVIEAVETISTDFQEQREPFDDVEFPEARFLREMEVGPDGERHTLDNESRMRFLAAFCSLDYNRNASQLVDKLIELHEKDPSMFNTHTVEASKSQVEHYFEKISFRYPSRDAHAWHKNNRIIVEKYNGQWNELIMDTGCDAVALVERLKADDFNVLKGVKVAPMFARIINDEVCELSNLWDLDIPVDTHIRRLSKDLFSDMWDEDELTDDLIRQEWRGLAIEADIDRQVVDGALWHIGNKWDDWGKDYWESL